MKFKITNRQFLSAAIIIFYLIPLLFFAGFNIAFTSQYENWTLFSLGLLLTAAGTFALTLLLFYWEQAVRRVKKKVFPSSSLSFQDPLPDDKDAKVTSIDPALSLEQEEYPQQEDEEEKIEVSKKLNLLEIALKNNQEQQELLSKEMELKIQELEKQTEENKQLEFKAFQIAQDFADYKLFTEEQLKQKSLQLSAFQQMIEDQRTEMEKRQDQIYQLDTKVHDLSYEIKTLLFLNQEESVSNKFFPYYKEPEPAHNFLKTALTETQEQACAVINTTQHYEPNSIEKPIRTPLEASNLLKKCINMAQKLTGANYHSSETSRYREFSSSNYAIDQRRLFDNLRSETGALIIVYSQKEHKLLFVNQETKTLLDWSPDKFIADFSTIMHEGINEWKKALSSLATSSDAQARLLAKTKQGQELILNCHLGIIPTGLFRHYVIGILYPA